VTPTLLAPLASPTLPRERSAATKPARLPFVDGLRGLAILIVLTYHCWVHTIHAAIWMPLGVLRLDVTAPLHYGYVGVHLFLLLSGFCLTYPLARRGQERGDARGGLRVEWGRFFQRRAWRILPPYYAALAGFALLRTVLHARGQSEAVSPANLLAHVFMVYNLFPQWLGAINGSFWSLALEWQLYMIFPLLVWSIRRWGLKSTLGAVLALTVSYRTWVYLTKDTTQLGPAYYYCYSLPGRLFEFALGMAAAVLLARQGTAVVLKRTRWYLLAAGLLGLLALTAAHCWSPYSPVTDVLWGAAFFCLLLYAGGRSAEGGGWLEWRPLETLGLFSYSVYLIHEPLIRFAYAFLVRSRLHSPVATLLLFEVGMLPLLIGLGWIFYSLVESRFIRMGKARAEGVPERMPVLHRDQEWRQDRWEIPAAYPSPERGPAPR
jgi:peptidoglycan/LPS O-acetylase OafA/YrhL